MPGHDNAATSLDLTAKPPRPSRLLGEVAAEANAAFGTSGVRGRVEDLTPELCWAYTAAFLSLFDQRVPVLIGHDLRPSSPAISAVCHAAARHLGFETLHAGALPTPALAFAAQGYGGAAIMVTGSHIPFDRNGIKFYRESGEITKADEHEMLSFPMPVTPTIKPLTLPDADREILNLYLGRYRRLFQKNALSGLRVGVYEHSSVARDILHQLLRDFGATTISLGRTANFVAVDTEAVTAEDRKMAAAWASTHELDAIITTDGDADRPLVADENGTWLRGDLLGLICAREIGASAVVTPITSTSTLEITGHFHEIIRTRIGSPHVIAGMRQSKQRPVVGYEANGGFLLGSDVLLPGGTLTALPTRDAVLPILMALVAARRYGCLSRLASSMAKRHSFSDRIQNINTEVCRHLLQQLDADPARIDRIMNAACGPLQSVNKTDGIRFTFESGDTVHLRLSGNAPELRCYTEASEAERAEQLCRMCLLAMATELK